MNDIFKDLIVVKRTGQRVAFNGTKVAIAICKGFESVYDNYDVKKVNKVYERVLEVIAKNYSTRKTINVEDIQNIIEESLKELGFFEVYDSFSRYRLNRARSRDVFGVKPQHKFVKAIEKVGYLAKENSCKKPDELTREFAKIVSKEFATSYLIEGKALKALEEGTIYVNDLYYYSIGNTSSSHLNIEDIHDVDINNYFNEIIKILILASEDQYKEHSLMNFDTNLTNCLIETFKKIFLEEFFKNLKLVELDVFIDKNKIEEIVNALNNLESKKFLDYYLKNDLLKRIFNISYENTLKSLKHTLKINFEKMFNMLEINIDSNYKKVIISFDNKGTFLDNLIITTYLNCLKFSQKIITNIFINDNVEINEKIFKAIKTAKINLILEKNYAKNYFSNGEFIYNNINGIKTSKGRIINSTSTINLVRIALKNNNLKSFLEELSNVMELNKNALIQRYDIQANKLKENYNIIFDNNQKIRKILRHGAFIMGYTGLVEATYLLNKKDGSFNHDDFDLMMKIIKTIKSKCDTLTNELKLNFIPAEIYDEKVIKEFVRIDKSIYGSKISNDIYEPVYKVINNSKLSANEKIDMNAIYQNVTSSIIKYDLKNMDFKKYLKLLEEIKSSKIKYIGFNV